MDILTKQDKIEYVDFLYDCLKNKQLTKEFDRLSNTNITESVKKIYNRCGLTKAIDEACGYSPLSNEEIKQFDDFVYEYIWLPVYDKFNAETQCKNTGE